MVRDIDECNVIYYKYLTLALALALVLASHYKPPGEIVNYLILVAIRCYL